MRVGSLDQEDLLESEMATHSSIIAWKIQWTEMPGGLHSVGSNKSQTRLSAHAHTHTQSRQQHQMKRGLSGDRDQHGSLCGFLGRE